MLKQEQEPETNYDVVISRLPEADLELEAPPETEALVADAEVISSSDNRLRSRSRRRVAHRIALTACVLSFLFGFPGCMLASQLSPSQWVAYIIAGSILTFFGLVGIPMATLISMYYSNAHASANEPMPAVTGIAAIGPLLDRMATDTDNIGVIRFALTAPLMQITPEDTMLLEARHYKHLNVYLQRAAWEYNVVRAQERAYLIAVLHAYSCVGDPRAIPNVERIAKGRANASLRDEEVRAAAVRCLEHLNVAKEQLSHHKTLLRSSQISYPTGELVCGL